MGKAIRFVGLDQHAATIAVAVAESGRDGEVRSLGTIANRPEAVRKLVAKLGPPETLRFCYEAGPCGYGIGPRRDRRTPDLDSRRAKASR